LGRRKDLSRTAVAFFSASAKIFVFSMEASSSILEIILFAATAFHSSLKA